LLKTCRKLGIHNTYGVDPSLGLIKLLRQRGLEACLGSISQIPYPNVHPGVIILGHILEHLLDVKSALDSLRERIGNEGIVYVEVPDALRYAECTSRENSPLRFFYFQHVIHFDEVHLDNLFFAHGFRKLEGGQRVRLENELVLPARWSIYGAASGGSALITPDFRLARQMKLWFDEGSLDPRGVFADLARRGTRVFLWGIGIHVQLMLGMSPLRDCNIAYCVDQDPKLHQRTLDGRKIVPTEILREAGEGDTVVIGSIIHRQKMQRYLWEEIGFRGNVVWF
jgi:hypothetical protein